MGSFEWLELETLISDITAARSRLAEARASRDRRLIRALEEEIAEAEARRTRLLAQITSTVVSVPEGTGEPEKKDQVEQTETTEAADSPAQPAPVDEPVPDEVDGQRQSPEIVADGEQQSPEIVERIVGSSAAAPASAPKADSAEGGTSVWDRLTPGDIERAKQDIDARRAEMLARHAEELQGLDADQAELDTLEQAIDAFLQKFRLPSSEGEVVRLDEERGLRAQGNG